jgi:hypothetical protein
MNMKKALDKKYETMTFKQLTEAPVSALEGVSDGDAKLLEQALGIKTIRDLGTNKFFRAAMAIAIAAEVES